MAGSRTTVLVAGGANLSIAVAKIAVGLFTGSSAIMAEGAHSIADTLDQAFLLTALSRSRKRPDARHPFGYGMERYFWSLLAAVGIFVLGAGFSFLEGILELVRPEPITNLPIALGVLALAFVIEGVSWTRAMLQLRREAGERRVSVVRHLLHGPDPTAKTVAFEDTAALIGLVLATLGASLHVLTGYAVCEAIASMLIGVLLIVVAYALGAQNMHMLVGRAMPAETRDRVRGLIDESGGVDHVVELLTMQLGPDDVLVAARVDVEDRASGADLERIADEVDRRVRESFPEVRHVFLDPTPS